jgi:hypothetical protein
MNEQIIRDLIDRVPALRELRGYARLEAEESIGYALADAIEDHMAACQVVTGSDEP